MLALHLVCKETAVYITEASVKRRTEGTEPLNDLCFDFTDELKHCELSHFILQTSMQHKKSKTKANYMYCNCFISKLNLKMEVFPAGQLVARDRALLQLSLDDSKF